MREHQEQIDVGFVVDTNSSSGCDSKKYVKPTQTAWQHHRRKKLNILI